MPNPYDTPALLVDSRKGQHVWDTITKAYQMRVHDPRIVGIRHNGIVIYFYDLDENRCNPDGMLAEWNRKSNKGED